jgi:hypothetical protein
VLSSRPDPPTCAAPLGCHSSSGPEDPHQPLNRHVDWPVGRA